MRLSSVFSLSALLLGSASALKDATVPLFLWSGGSYFTGHKEIGERVSANSIEDVVRRISGANDTTDSTLLHYTTISDATPEVMIAFVSAELDTAEFARSQGAYSSRKEPSSLQTTMWRAASSLTAPYMRPEEGVSQQLRKAIATNANSRVVELSADSNGECPDFQAHLPADLFSNHITDLVVVSSNIKNGVPAKCLVAVDRFVSTQSNGNYVALLSGEGSSTEVTLTFGDVQPSPLSRRLLSSAARKLETQADPVYEGPQYINSILLFGLIFMHMLLFTLWCAVSNLMAIESPVRFAAELLEKSKEF